MDSTNNVVAYLNENLDSVNDLTENDITQIEIVSSVLYEQHHVQDMRSAGRIDVRYISVMSHELPLIAYVLS